MQPLIDGDPRHVGRFEIIGRLGSGGMGRVYLARAADGEQFALKMIHQFLSDDVQFRRRFNREVSAARRVTGAHTADLVDADPDARPPWMAVEYVDGPTLTELIDEDGPLDMPACVDLAAGMAQALLDIHAADLVHRDLKPSNVLMAEAGPCLIDFGIAQASGASSLTMTGLVTGSAGYMSPEQAQADRVTAASDVFALGTVLYFAATGRRPFGEGTSIAVTYRVVHGEAYMPAVADDGLRRLIADCLLKDPLLRPSAQQVLERCPGVKDGSWRNDPALAAGSGSASAETSDPDDGTAVAADPEQDETLVAGGPAVIGAVAAVGAGMAPAAAKAAERAEAEVAGAGAAGVAELAAGAESAAAENAAEKDADDEPTLAGVGATDATLSQPAAATTGVAAIPKLTGKPESTSTAAAAGTSGAKPTGKPEPKSKGTSNPYPTGAAAPKAGGKPDPKAATPVAASTAAAGAATTAGAATAGRMAPVAVPMASPWTPPSSERPPRRGALSYLPQPLWATAVAAVSVLVAGSALTVALVVTTANRSEKQDSSTVTNTPGLIENAPTTAPGAIPLSPTPSSTRTVGKGIGTKPRYTVRRSPTPTPTASLTATSAPTPSPTPTKAAQPTTTPPAEPDPPVSTEPDVPPVTTDPGNVDPTDGTGD
jgi:hypothetical protein